jgi:uncharacterized membrane protein
MIEMSLLQCIAMKTAENRLEASRLIGFSDGVFAIAITLLV